ncbi:TetR/AcrR family transcriptional regulator [Rhodopirellula bahusiensis]|uniref:TetR family transcriptional regulator n=1 Tax=Rhodopirellula bahusiensis TaxID=2014065 RepID=A0A2G1VZL1_9BACT|nr:TetR family transcriptional regulator [Rhodopirellula bahusiensis]PHQ32228.1 TetR family transcriptional regulator [Rhodopirellula bahusiensis]
MSWQRARQPGQKAERVATILDAAATLFDEKEFADISMRDVASSAGLGKASLYHYFSTKEEVFICLYREELNDWFLDVERRLKRLRAPTPKRIAKSLTDAIRDRDRFCRLTVVLASVLERNLSTEFIREFKRSLLPPLEQCAAALQSVQPDMSPAAVHEFLVQHHAVISGLWPLARPSEEVSAVMQEEEFRGYQVDFYRLFESTIRQLMQAN